MERLPKKTVKRLQRSWKEQYGEELSLEETEARFQIFLEGVFRLRDYLAEHPDYPAPPKLDNSTWSKKV